MTDPVVGASSAWCGWRYDETGYLAYGADVQLDLAMLATGDDRIAAFAELGGFDWFRTSARAQRGLEAACAALIRAGLLQR